MTFRWPLAMLPILAFAASAEAQGVRVTGSTSARYIELRPLVDDSIPVGATTGTGLLRRAPDGAIVRCAPGEAYCRYRRPAAAVGLVPVMQDIEINAWGLGRGVRAHAQVRGRASWGEASHAWPRADDPLDVLAAYVDVDRGALRARFGRQWKTSGLGFYNYDGASIVVRPRPWVSAEVYGGWSLIRGLNESFAGGALAAIEDLAPTRRDHLIGAEVRVRPAPFASVGALFQREIRTDRAALHSDRVAANAHVARWGRTLDLRLDSDLARREVNEARLRATSPVAGAWTASVEARRYRPFFELWTIWGAFSPVGFSEVRAGAGWAPAGDAWRVRLDAARRWYHDAGTGIDFAPIRTDAWRVEAAAIWRPVPAWTVHGGYRVDLGFGAARSDGDLGVFREVGPFFVGLGAAAFQSVHEFRVGEGTVAGLGADAGMRLGPEARVSANLFGYRHLNRGVGASPDWTQMRGSLRLDWTVGRDPGLPPPARGTQ